ncbi:MAG: hypothetical protein ACOY3D_04700 [Candidatus Omnitrophota bacterium]
MPKSEKEEARLKFLEKEAKDNIFRKTLPSVITAMAFGAVVFLAANYLFDFSRRLTPQGRLAVRPAPQAPSVVYPRDIPAPSMVAPQIITPREYAASPSSLPKPKHWKEYDTRCDPGLVGHDDCEPTQRSLIEPLKARGAR